MTQSRLARRELKVELENGLHMVPCSAIAKAAMEFNGPVRIIHGEIIADASSVFDLLGLGAMCGTVIILEADGEGADELLDRLQVMFQKDFDVKR